MSNRDHELSSLLSSASLVLLGTVLSSFARLIERVIIGRSVSMDAYGQVSIGLAILSLAASLCLLGFSQGVPRFMSRYEDQAQKRGVWLTGLVVTLSVSTLVAAILLAVAGPLAAYISQPDSVPLLQLLFVAIPLAIGGRIGVSTIQGFENTRYRTYVQDLLHPLSRIFLLVALFWVGYDILAVGYAYLVAAAIAFVVSHLLVSRLMPLRGAVRFRTRELVWFSLPITISGFLAILVTQTDTLMLGYFWTTTEVALYSAAYPLAIGLRQLLNAFNFLYLPLASRLDAQDERLEIEVIYQVTTKWIFLFTFPAFLTFAVFSGDVLAIFFGEQYRAAALAMTVLTVGNFSNAILGQNLQTISSLGDSKYLMLTNGVAFIVNVVLNLLLIPQYGAVGAAVASAISFTALNLTANAVLWRKFRISPFSRWSVRTFVPLSILGPVAAVVVAQWVSLSVVTVPVFAVCAGVASIVVAALFGGLQPEDRVAVEYVERLVGRRIPLIRRYIPAEGEGSALIS